MGSVAMQFGLHASGDGMADDEKRVRSLVQAAVEETVRPLREDISFLRECMTRLLGDPDDSRVPESLRKKGMLVEIQESQGKHGDQLEVLTTKSDAQDARLSNIEANQHRIRRMLGAACRWMLAKSEEGKVLWHRVLSGVVFVGAILHGLHLASGWIASHGKTWALWMLKER